MALKALHVAYAYQTLAVNASDPQATGTAPYNGFADGPVVTNATTQQPGEVARGRAGVGKVVLSLTNAAGMRLTPTHECGVGEFAGPGNGCCAYDRTFEVCTANCDGPRSEWDDTLWAPVPPQDVALHVEADGTARIELAVARLGRPALQSARPPPTAPPSLHGGLGAGAGPGAGVGPMRVRHAHQMYPQCVLMNSNGLVASPFLLNVTTNAVGAAPRATHVAGARGDVASGGAGGQDGASPGGASGVLGSPGVVLTPPMGFTTAQA